MENTTTTFRDVIAQIESKNPEKMDATNVILMLDSGDDDSSIVAISGPNFNILQGFYHLLKVFIVDGGGNFMDKLLSLELMKINLAMVKDDLKEKFDSEILTKTLEGSRGEALEKALDALLETIEEALKAKSEEAPKTEETEA